MILNSFKSNNLITPLLGVLLLSIIWFKSFYSPTPYQYLDFGLLYHFKNSLHSIPNSVGTIINILILILSAGLINKLVNQSNFFDKNTFLPFVLYLLLMSVYSDFNTLNPISISNLFLILYLTWAFKIKRQEDARELIFNAAFLLSCATLFFPIFSPFLLSPFLLLMAFRPFIWREWALAGLGLLIPALFYAFLIYFLDLPFEDNTYNASFWELISLSYVPKTQHYTFIALFTILSVFSFFILNKKISMSSLRLRTLMKFLTLNFIALSILSFFLFFITESFILISSLPLTIFFSYYFYYAKSFWSNLFFYILIGSILFSIYFV